MLSANDIDWHAAVSCHLRENKKREEEILGIERDEGGGKMGSFNGFLGFKFNSLFRKIILMLQNFKSSFKRFILFLLTAFYDLNY